MAAATFSATINPTELLGPTSNSDLLDGDTSSCSHIQDAFADDDLKRRMTQAYKNAVGWRVQRLHDNAHSNKRRKVRLLRKYLSIELCRDATAVSARVRDVPQYFGSPICLPSMLICGVLA